jgi:transcriptional regulator with XRE-family HTH domain
LADLADAAGLGVSTACELEAGRTRPSEATCRALAGALRPDSDPVTVAILDLTLRRAAGDSLQVWQRRKPPRRAVQRVYAEAAERLAELDRVDGELFVAEFEAAFNGLLGVRTNEEDIMDDRQCGEPIELFGATPGAEHWTNGAAG